MGRQIEALTRELETARRELKHAQEDRRNAYRAIVEILKRLNVWENYERHDLIVASEHECLNLSLLMRDLEMDESFAEAPNRLGPLSLVGHTLRCDKCGKFRKPSDCVHMENDFEEWIECRWCISPADGKFRGPEEAEG